jgi:glutathione S-transferase
MSHQRITLYCAPHSRSVSVLALLQELHAEFDVQVLNLHAGDSRKPEYLAINPMGKVPAVLYNGALVTEQPAIFIYLADLYAEAGLAPAFDDSLRGPYLRWLVFYGSCFEPALMDKSLQHAPAPSSRSPYGDYDIVMKTLNDRLAQGPWLLGDRFTAADLGDGTGVGHRLQAGAGNAPDCCLCCSGQRAPVGDRRAPGRGTLAGATGPPVTVPRICLIRSMSRHCSRK